MRADNDIVGDEKTMMKALLMLEVLGKPPEYVLEILNKVVGEIGKQPEVKIVKRNISDAKPLKDNPHLYTAFAELEIETDLMRLMSIIYNFMPSHVEIITPEELKISNADMNLFFNELISRLHRYDEVAKSIMIEKQILAEKLKKGALKLEDLDIAPAKKTRKKR